MHRRISPLFIIVLTAVLTLAACSDTQTTEEDVSSDAGTSSDAEAPGDTTTTTTDVAVRKPIDVFACPGGHNCECAQHSDCLSGLCFDSGDGKRCAEPCEHVDCQGARVCRRVVLGGKGGFVCVPPRVNLCNPCKTSTACEAIGLKDSACVDYGERGAFCGAACLGDADCGEGYTCQMTTAIEGTASLQCVRVDKSGLLADCECSEDAIKGELETLCTNTGDGTGGACKGKRKCGAAGLTKCTAPAPTAEKCDGADNDCDGQTDEDTCSDNNPCTDDSCDIQLGCANANNNRGCDADGSVCTADDKCDGGACKAGKPVTCDDGDICTKDACDKTKGCVFEGETGAACDADGSLCTASDKCVAGVCTAGALKDCDDKKACTIDACDGKTGKCSNTLVPHLSCDDGNPCTHTDLCDEKGGCAGKKVSCDDGNPCTQGACTKDLGCTSTAVPDGASCDDGNLCTAAGTCVSGQCAGAKAKVCTSNKTCVASLCDGSTGTCKEQAAKVGALCTDGNACTSFDGCDAQGVCKGSATKCNDFNACTKDSCDKTKGGCQNVAISGACDDGDACTVGETCSGKAGAVTCGGGKPKDCDDGEPCTTDSCKGGCVNTALKDGAACSDGKECTKPDSCKAGKCKAGPDTCSCSKSADCDDSDPCTTDTCGSDSKCSSTPGKSGDSCDDGNPCTTADTCQSADGKLTCAGGKPKVCDDKNQCTTDSCDPKTGCTSKPKANGATCDDGEPCTDSDACASGKCVGKPKTAAVGTLAGSGQGFKDGTGASAQFNVPTGLALAADGAVYVADTFNHRIRKITKDGKATVLAGGPLAGQKNGAALSASFNKPTGIAIDGAGNLYIADRDNHLIRKIAKDGTVSTVAGSNEPGGFGQPLKGGYKDDKGTAAKFNSPSALFLAGGALYVADTGNNRVRKVTLAGVVTTVAGSGAAGFADGKGTAAKFNAPAGIVSSGGVLYVGDTGNHRVRKIAADGTVTTLAGSGTGGFKDGKGTAAQFNEPMGLWVDGLGALLVCDNKNHRIRTLKMDGTVTSYAGAGDQDYKEGDLGKAKFDQPSAIVTDGKGKSWIADRGNHRVRSINDGPKTCAIANQGD
ncbi:MAG: hypothetical protein KC502_09995 [Myxococcales bacterium]|nr:hypothetical protein [Myxococcales bacterium]